MRFRFSCLLTIALLSTVITAQAQLPQDATTGGLPERIIRPMRATDPMTLKAEGVNIHLWGIKPARTSETPLELKALDLMDTLIHEQQVNCKIISGIFPDMVGRCATEGNEDLALALLSNGYVVVDRQQTYNSVFATGYEKAQEAARLKGKGVWRFVDDSEAEGAGLPKWLKPYLGWLIPLSLMLGPFSGLVVVAVVMRAGLRRISMRQEDEALQASNKETMLQSRERQVLASTLEGELSENKNKVEAFLSIYGDFLRTLRNPGEMPKYQQGGDIVQKHPAFSKTVFDANIGRLSLLNIQTAGALSKLYASLPSAPEYINLDPHVPLETAIKLVEKIIADAEGFMPAMEQAVQALRAATQDK